MRVASKTLRSLTVAVALGVVALVGQAGESGYLGREVCAGCHKEIAATQMQTAMARTWQGSLPASLPAGYSETHMEGPSPAIQYLVRRLGQSLTFQVRPPGQPALDVPVEATMGGTRHGISFLLRLREIDGLPLARAPLIEGRYLHYAPGNHLALSPGFPTEKPSKLETMLGRVLAPNFEKKCLTCHGEPRLHGTHTETGVSCESCHGPGQPHLVALGKKSADKGILNPAKLPTAEKMRPCSQCHAGFSMVQDPMPDDLLISDQVTALGNSECWRQTAGQITCTNCHNPHQDAPRAVVVARSEKTCLQCHRETVAGHAGVCPVNRASGCVGCHMPEETRAPFVISDHWIRVHPGQKPVAGRHPDTWRSQVVPKRLFLRMIATDDRSKADGLREQLLSGASFFELARANSTDRNLAAQGGFLGDVDASQIDPGWAKSVLALEPGDISEVVEADGRYLIFQRMPRNFREEAEARFNKGMELRKESKRQEAAAEFLEALKIYPQFLRALTYLGISYGEAGNPQAGAGILSLATRLYPQDAGAHFNLGIANGAMGNENEISEYRRALEIDPDFVPAYLNWGGALFGKGQYKGAIDVYRRGIEVNPLLASLHYSLSVALEQDGQAEAAKAELALAWKMDPVSGGR